jgi:hypothetical protein
MIGAERWLSRDPNHAGQWYWYVFDETTGTSIARGYAADEWLARANIRITIKNQTPETK